MGLFGTRKDEAKQKVMVQVGRHVQDFGDGSGLKSDLAMATSLPIEQSMISFRMSKAGWGSALNPCGHTTLPQPRM